jgi:hypothetical protein
MLLCVFAHGYFDAPPELRRITRSPGLCLRVPQEGYARLVAASTADQTSARPPIVTTCRRWSQNGHRHQAVAAAGWTAFALAAITLP